MNLDSVGLNIPKKFQRTDEKKHSLLVEQTFRLLHQALRDEQRRSALLDAEKAFNHDSEDLHNIEVEKGIVSALCLQLGYILNKGSQDGRDILSIYDILSLVYLCSDATREKSFNEVGIDLLHMTCNAFEYCRLMDVFQPLCYHMMKVMRSLSRIKLASINMVRQPDVLNVLQVAISESNKSRDSKLEAVATLKNMSFYAEEYRILILQHPMLVDSMIRICMDCGNDLGREFSSAVLRNIAMALNTKIPMAEHPCLLDTLAQLTEDNNPKTKRNAVSAIGSLSIEEDNNLVLVTHGEGIIVRIMTRLLEEDEDSVIRRRAARALRCIGRRDTVDVLVDFEGIIDILYRATMHDSSIEVKVEAGEALASFVSHSKVISSSHDNIVIAMIKITKTSTSASCVEVAAKTLNKITSFEGCRKSMINHNHLLKTLAFMITSSKATIVSREHATCAIFNLTCETENRDKMTSKTVLQALVSIASSTEAPNHEAQIYAVRALINLAVPETNRKCLANEKGLLKSLLHYAANSHESAIKNDVKATIMDLIPVL